MESALTMWTQDRKSWKTIYLKAKARKSSGPLKLVGDGVEMYVKNFIVELVCAPTAPLSSLPLPTALLCVNMSRYNKNA